MTAAPKASSGQTVRIEQHRGGQCTQQTDLVAIEEPMEIQLVSTSATGAAARSLSITMRTPGNDRDLGLGFLVSESIIRDPDDILQAEMVGPAAANGAQNTLRIEVKPNVQIDLPKLERHFYTTSSCGVCGKASLDALDFVAAEKTGDTFSISRQKLLDLPNDLRAQQPRFDSTGGLHGAAAFSSGGELRHVREDVGRHNAVDKVIGALFAERRLPARGLGLVVSGRTSFELVQKALVAGMPMLVAVSAPTSLAVQLAEEHDMTLVGFLRGKGFNIYSAAQRITD